MRQRGNKNLSFPPAFRDLSEKLLVKYSQLLTIACCSLHSTLWSGVCHTPQLHSEWNGMPEFEYNSTLGTRLVAMSTTALCE